MTDELERIFGTPCNRHENPANSCVCLPINHCCTETILSRLMKPFGQIRTDLILKRDKLLKNSFKMSVSIQHTENELGVYFLKGRFNQNTAYNLCTSKLSCSTLDEIKSNAKLLICASKSSCLLLKLELYLGRCSIQ